MVRVIRSARAALVARANISEALLGQLGWSTASYGVVQVIRFGQNLLLTHLLAPGLFGIMIVLTSLRVGIELFTDIGISQNVIANKDAWKPQFYNTAWTIQIIRGFLLGGVFLALLPLIARFYDHPEINQMLPVLSILFVLTGLHAVQPALAAKALDTKRFARYEVLSTLIGSIFTIIAAVMSPNLLGLVAGNILATIVSTVSSYFVLKGIHHRFHIERAYVKTIISFGKWIFVSSIVYFLASNFDRLTLGKYITLSALGVYGIARSLGDILGQFALRLGNAIVFPLIASTNLDRKSLRAKLSKRRTQFLLLASLASALFISSSDIFVDILYDQRYHSASSALPWVGLATWLFIVNSISDSIMLGLSNPRSGALGSVAKFAALLIALPFAAYKLGIAGAAIATIAAEVLRYLVLMVAQWRANVQFIKVDLAMAGLVVALALVIRAVLHIMHLVPSPAHLFWIAG